MDGEEKLTHSWTLSLLWVLGGALEAFSTQNCMLLWMQARGYDRGQNVTYPLGVTGVGIASTLATAILIDATGRHMPWGLLACGLQVVASSLLISGGVPDGAVFAGYCAYFSSSPLSCLLPLISPSQPPLLSLMLFPSVISSLRELERRS